MEPSNKKSIKNQEQRGEEYDLDHLSSLPDSILTHIFSFLDSYTVIQTSVLSKRYRLLWTLSQCLDFRLFEFNDENLNWEVAHRYPRIAKKVCDTAFESYVNHILQWREHSNLVRFRLSLHKIVGLEFAQNCVFYAAEHKVQHLRIRGYFHWGPLVLPQMLLNLPSLISLNLRNATSNSIELPKSVSLPNLKSLCLKNFKFSDYNYNGGLFSGCPNLETLVLYKCRIEPMSRLKVLNVNCLNLKHLEIKQWRSPWRCFDEHKINVNAPKLVFFKFQGHLVRMSFNEVLPCLERACFDVFFPASCVMNVNERKEKTSECFLNMLLSVCNVTVISLSLKTIEVVCSLRDLRIHAPVIFENLRVINFTVENKYGEKTIPIETVNRLLGRIATDDLIFDDHKIKKVFPDESSEARPMRKCRHICIPTHFMQFLLESSPAAEILSLEVPNLSPDEDDAEELA